MKSKNNPADAAAALTLLKYEISSGRPRPLYLFYGEEAYLREYYIGELKKLILLPDESNLHVFEGGALDPGELSEALTSFSLTAERSLVLVRDYDILCTDAKAAAQLLPAIEGISGAVCAIFAYGSGAPGEGRKNKAMSEAVERIALSVEFTRPPEGDYLRWIARRFAALGKECGKAEAKLLSEICGGLMYCAIPEIEKLAAFTPGARITKQDIESLCVPLGETIIYKMSSAVASGAPLEAVSELSALYDQGIDAKSAVMEIGRAMRRLYAAGIVLSSGGGVSEYMSLSGVKSPYGARIELSQGKRFSLPELRRAVKLCNRAERELLFGRTNERALVETLIFELCGK